MESTRGVDREQFDQAAELLMESLRKSKALNSEIREALRLREQAEMPGPKAGEGASAAVFGILRDIINDVSRT